jgi:Xaa-Pro aminopeptidase
MTRLERLRDRMAATNTDLVALAPGPHMRWLLRFAPSPDERACFLLVGQEQAGFVMPALNASDARQHTDLPFWEWRDDDGPDGALEAACRRFAGPCAACLWTKGCVLITPFCCLMLFRTRRGALHPKRLARFG